MTPPRLSATAWPALDFKVPAALAASEPPEARGLARDEVRLLVSYRQDDRLVHTRFQELGRYLKPGDVLVVNTSGTRPAALDARRQDGTPLALHLSTELADDRWLVEVRRPARVATEPFDDGRAGETLYLPAGASATLHRAHDTRRRLWLASLTLPSRPDDYLAAHGRPIRYRYVPEEWPIACYQTVYATEPGSAEMPSAGRAFTPELLTGLMAHEIRVAPLLLHTGVASQEAGEPPYEEFYRVPAVTARTVNAARAYAGRVIAVGTTVVRALETVADEAGQVQPGEGWTDLVITPQRGLRAVDGLLTGLHEPQASHLALLEALAGPAHLQRAYRAALQARYLWHEFGDLHLILP